MRTPKEIAKILRNAADKIENGTCGVDIENLQSIATMALHIKMYTEDVCKHLNISRATLTRKLESSNFPKPHKEPGGKQYWYQDEIEEYINPQMN